MRNISYWELESYLNNIDDLVIGGGIVGLSAAFYLKEANASRRVVVVERDPFSAGASTKNAGFACFGSPTELASDLIKMTAEELITLIRLRWEGLRSLRGLLGDESIQYQACGGMELFREAEEMIFDKCLEEMSYYNQLVKEAIGMEAYMKMPDLPRFGGSKKFIGGIFNKHEGSLHTGRMMRSLKELCTKRGIEFFNGIEISDLSIDHSKVFVNIGGVEIKPSRVFVCVNGFAKKLLPEIEVTPVRNQVLVTNQLKHSILPGTYHVDEGYVYFRPIDGRILIGGFRNMDEKNETTDEFGITAFIQNKLENFISDYITSEKIVVEHRWSGILGIGSSKMPIVERINDRVFVGVRMGGMGVAIGNLIGKKLSDLAI